MKILELKNFIKLRLPQGEEPKDDIQKKEWRNYQKVPLENGWTKNEKLRYSYKEIENHPNIGMIIPNGLIVVDVDDSVNSEKISKVLDNLKIKHIKSITGNGMHFIFKDIKDSIKQGSKIISKIFIPIDTRLPGKGQIACKFLPDATKDNQSGFRLQNTDLDLDDLDELPMFLRPLKKQTKRAKEIADDNWLQGSRDDNLRDATNILLKTEANKKETKELIKIINYVLMDPPLLDKENFDKKVDKWLEYVEENKDDEINLKDDIYDFSVFFGKQWIKYLDLATYFVSKEHIKFHNENFWIKNNNNEWYSVVSEDYIYIKLIHLIGNWFHKLNKPNMISAIKSVSYMKNTEDNDKYVNLLNGRYNIQSKKLENYEDKSRFFTFGLNIKYEENFKNDFIDNTLDQWVSNSQKDREALEEFLGSCLLKSNKWAKALVLLGNKAANGKSTFIKMTNKFLGDDFVSATSIEELERNSHATAGIVGKRLISIDELKGEGYLDKVNVFKSIITGGKIHINPKFKPPYSIYPEQKLLAGANNIPKFADKTNGIWRRFHLIEFKNEYTGLGFNEEDLWSEEGQKRLLILAINGLHRFLKGRTYALSENSNTIKEKYKILNDPILAWVQDTEETTYKFINEKSLTDNWSNFKYWSDDNGHPGYSKLSKIAFKEELSRIKGIKIYRNSEKEGYKISYENMKKI